MVNALPAFPRVRSLEEFGGGPDMQPPSPGLGESRLHGLAHEVVHQVPASDGSLEQAALCESFKGAVIRARDLPLEVALDGRPMSDPCSRGEVEEERMPARLPDDLLGERSVGTEAMGP